MEVVVNDPEEKKQAYTAYSGKVLSLDTIVKTSVHGGTTHSVLTGTDFSVHSTSVELKKARVVLSNGRIKEFNTEGMEMQEGDSVEFITAENGKTIFVRNLATGDFKIADPTYRLGEGGAFVIFACLGCIAYGLYALFSQGQFVRGFGCIALGVVIPLGMGHLLETSKSKSALDFRRKVEGTGIQVPKFKPLRQVQV